MKTELELKDIKIGRLQKRIRKLTEQRDHLTKQNEFLNNVLKLFPYARKTYEEKEINRAKLSKLSDWEAMVPALINEHKRITNEYYKLMSELDKMKKGIKNEHS